MKAKKITALIAAAIMALTVCLGISVPVRAEGNWPAEIKEEAVQADYSGKLVILHSNDVHGALDGYAKMAALRAQYEEMGAQVLMIDAGDFSQGDPYVNYNNGLAAINMMNAAGYDLAIPGNHEFDYGVPEMMANFEAADFPVISANIYYGGESLLEPNMVFTAENGLKIGFFALDTPETKTKVNPVLVKGVDILASDSLAECARQQVALLKDEGVDMIIALTHLGVNEESGVDNNRSLDVLSEVEGIDFCIDGHSHTVMTSGKDGELIQSTGTKFANIGVVVIEADGTISDHYLIATDNLASDEKVTEAAAAIKAEVDAKYDVVIGYSEVELTGERALNRTVETNNGDIVTDAFLWYVEKNSDLLEGFDGGVVALISGGSIRDKISQGDVTKKDLYRVHPFGNTINIIYVKGSELLEILEASTFNVPDQTAGYPQTAGLNFTVDATKAYDAGEQYPDSTYHRPLSIQRVSIQSVGGEPFDAEADYAIVCSDFLSAGGDTYSVLAGKTPVATGAYLDDILCDYIKEELGGVITEEKYGKPRGNVTIIYENIPQLTPDSIELYLGEWVKTDSQGRPDFSYTGVAQNSNGWWYVKNGVVDFTDNSIRQNENGWWYIRNGKVDFTYTGIAQNENGWWRIENGKVNFAATGVYQNEYGWWRVENGKVNFDATGIYQNENGWGRVENGKVNFGAEGIFRNETGWWHVKGGKVGFDYNAAWARLNGGVTGLE